jgi:acyl dehydratase
MSTTKALDGPELAEGQLVGRRYHVPRFPIDPLAAARFAAVCGDRPDRFRTTTHPGFVVRPALEVLNALLGDPALQAHRATMLHAQSDLRFRHPLVPGSAVQLDAEVIDAGPYGNGRGLVVATRVSDPAGRRLVDIETVLAFSHPALPMAEGRPVLPLPELYAHDGVVVASQDFVFDEGFPRRYADVSGDHNPIHLDVAAARSAGLPGVILHGMSTLSRGATFAMDALAGGDPHRIARLRVRFARPGRPGQIGRYTAYRTERPGRFALSCRLGGVAIWRHALLEVRP